ncbi:2OG-Fe(II) oxygenase [Azospirillum canadense]|uniref:2OG-Fe(II) oxygenase n=1 Tax=Azospirillum canadense TaxID=403962 RepID=UPI002227DF77|nr:2OG-Fe(II) oxygenase [Azospirillum canadense]MCW2237946.1 hypothetical protein [Azospirillum canadense]
MRSLLSGVTPADIRLDPYPHVVKTDVLDAETYAALSAGFPPFGLMGWANPDRPPPSNSRYQLSAWLASTMDAVAPAWKEFTRYHSSPAFFAEVAALFRDHWPDALKTALGGSLLGHSMGMVLRDDHGTARILQDARAEINTPVTAGPSVSRGAHLDTMNRLFTGLLYLRHPDDDAVGGDLQLFRWKNGPIPNLDVFQLPDDAVEVVATVPYRANTMVIFPQGIDAIHGVGLRHPTPHTRRYLFISGEIAENWLTPPTAATPAAP